MHCHILFRLKIVPTYTLRDNDNSKLNKRKKKKLWSNIFWDMYDQAGIEWVLIEIFSGVASGYWAFSTN